MSETVEEIDIYSEPEIKIKIMKPRNDRELRVKLSGKSIDCSIVNAIRRTILMDIPIYAFHRSKIFIDVDKCYYMYNNDMIYNQIETLPIFNVPNYFDLEDPETFIPTELMKNIFGEFKSTSIYDKEKEEKDSKKKIFKIELEINYKNNTDDYHYLTTHDVTIKINDEKSMSYLETDPISIIVLKPKEEIYLRAESTLGISKINAIYEATTNAIHEELSPTSYVLWYETLGQLTKEIIFSKACVILFKKLRNLHNFIKDNYEERNVSETIEIELYGEDDTLGNAITNVLQKCSFVRKAGYTKPHPFTRMIIISYKLDSKADIGPIKVLLDCIEYLVKLFTKICDMWTKKM
jgi:DNA-directed RNA polymerase subunit L